MLPDLNEDFLDFVKCLTHQSVDFIVVGAHALAFHGVARFTQDFDVWIRRTAENTRKLQAALAEFGIDLPEESARLLLEERKFLRFGSAPRRIEVLNFLDGCDFDPAYGRAIEAVLGGTSTRILAMTDYIATKKASGRPKDTSDLDLLREHIGQLPGE